jgi:molybdate transport system substrate-binding protein
MRNKHILAAFIFVFFYTVLFLLPGDVKANNEEEILIAAASNLKFALDDIITKFEKNRLNVRVKTIYGSSGNFFNQILNGAPFDIYFSADSKYPRELEKRNLGGKVTNYAFGRLVLMTQVDSLIDVKKLGLKSLFHPLVKKIAIANPLHAPYGKGAVSVMKQFKVYEKLKGKLVMGENIAQAAQFVESGVVEVGIIALSIAIKAREFGNVTYWNIPAETYPPISQDFIILKRNRKLELVKEFTDFVKSRQGKTILMKYGFDTPKNTQ